MSLLISVSPRYSLRGKLIDGFEELLVIFVKFPTHAADSCSYYQRCYPQVKNALFVIMAIVVVIESTEEGTNNQIDHHAAYRYLYLR